MFTNFCNLLFLFDYVGVALEYRLCWFPLLGMIDSCLDILGSSDEVCYFLWSHYWDCFFPSSVYNITLGIFWHADL